MEISKKIEFIKNINSPIFSLLDLKFDIIEQKKITCKIQVNERLHQPFGILHGGISVLISESLASLASYLNIDDNHNAVGIEINANHIRQVRNELIICECNPINIGRKIHIWETKIKSNEKLICISRCTVAVIEKALN